MSDRDALPPERTCSRGHASPAGHGYCGRCGEPLDRDTAPIWRTLTDAVHVVTYPPHLRRTLATTLVVGTLLFCINQLDVVLAGDATVTVWLKAALTYVVPFAVSNIGILIATHRQGP